MFALFVSGVFRDFWQNEIGDVFLANTCLKLGLNQADVDLIHYAGISQAPSLYTFNVNKDLIIQNQIITPTSVPTLDENGDPVLDGNGDPTYHMEDVVTYETASTITAEVYFSDNTFSEIC